MRDKDIKNGGGRKHHDRLFDELLDREVYGGNYCPSNTVVRCSRLALRFTFGAGGDAATCNTAASNAAASNASASNTSAGDTRASAFVATASRCLDSPCAQKCATVVVHVFHRRLNGNSSIFRLRNVVNDDAVHGDGLVVEVVLIEHVAHANLERKCTQMCKHI
jgi:hypothetical protein